MTSGQTKQEPMHGGQLRSISATYGIALDDLIDFSANINPAGPPASVIQAIHASLADPRTLTNYPDLELAELKQSIADQNGVRPEHISVANGFVPLLDAALRSLRIKRCLLPVPCFNEYQRTLENLEIEVVPYLLSQENCCSYNPDALFESLQSNECDAILFANPQNPTGVVSNQASMRRLIEKAAQHRINIFLDEAFIDYCPDNSLSRDAIGFSNLIVFRSVTKFFAVPGLRVAYAICNSSRTQAIHRYIAPWPVTKLAADAVCAALSDRDYEERSRVENETCRAWLVRELHRLGIETYPSSTNFLLLKLPPEIEASLLREKMIREQKIVLRSCGNFEGLDPGHLRTAILSQVQNERLVRGLEQVLSTLQ